ncbi:hypothetical protein D9M68_771880 [compost metagenome]
MPAVGDESLAAVEQVAAVGLFDGRGLHALQVAAGRGLAHGDGAHHLARGQPRQVLALLRLGAVAQDVRRHDLAVQAEADAAHARSRDLFHLRHRIQLVSAGAAIGLGHGHAEETVFAGLAPDFAVHVTLLFPAFVERRDFLLHETAKAVAEGFVVGVEEASFDHGSSPGVGLEGLFQARPVASQRAQSAAPLRAACAAAAGQS